MTVLRRVRRLVERLAGLEVNPVAAAMIRVDDLPPFLDRAAIELGDISIDGLQRSVPEYFTNPTLFRTQSGFCIVARYIASGRREIVSLQMDRNLIPTSATSISTRLRAADPTIRWFADPRYFRYRGAHYINFNTGHSSVPNSIYVAQLGDDGRPVGRAKIVVKEDGRTPIEKNWGFFECDGELFAVYTLSPFTVLQCDIGDDQIRCRAAYEHAWFAKPYEAMFGVLHGAASPVRVGDSFVALAQSHHPEERSREYYCTALSFDAHPPFRPARFSFSPLLALDEDERLLRPSKPLNPKVAACIYPSGLVADKNTSSFTVTYGINDYKAGLRRYDQDALLQRLSPIRSVERIHRGRPPLERPGESTGAATMRTFYWDGPMAPSSNRASPGNVGDRLQEMLISRLFAAAPLLDEKNGGRFLGIGSIAHRALAGDVIWGSGSKNRPMRAKRRERRGIEAFAVRGPLTLAYLAREGVNVSRVAAFFDPGLLIATLFGDVLNDIRQRSERRSAVVFVPHYKDFNAFRWRYARKGYPVLSPATPFLDFCAGLLSAELVVSSSLHGIVFAEALGVPALMHAPLSDEPVEKFTDYYEGTNRTRVPSVRRLRDLAARTPLDGPVINASAWLDTLPVRAELEEKGVIYAKSGDTNGRQVQDG